MEEKREAGSPVFHRVAAAIDSVSRSNCLGAEMIARHLRPLRMSSRSNAPEQSLSGWGAAGDSVPWEEIASGLRPSQRRGGRSSRAGAADTCHHTGVLPVAACYAGPFRRDLVFDAGARSAWTM